ncbi:hypothetical protein Anas_02746 [Armadillidium nasatum]|uniref:Uncharacterized protein n=1 Tax=Armadillidium nasatum TaxID=96803 RepID=A0A5N5TK48_9CRUS|nr:hypothetical protein Anas_02746 [Armadillidium nasatum]
MIPLTTKGNYDQCTIVLVKDKCLSRFILLFQETQSEVDLFGETLIRRPSILVSGLLVVLGVFDILISLACVALSAREACGPNSVHMGVFSNNDGHDKKERLYRWLGQQKYIFQASSNGQKNIASISQFVPLSSSGQSSPVRKYFSPPINSKSEHFTRMPLKSSLKPTGISGISEGNSSEVTNEKRSKASSGVTHSEKKNSSVIFLQPDNDFEVEEPFLIKRKHKSKAPPPPSQPSSLPPFMPLEMSHLTKDSLYSSHCPQHSQYIPLYAQAYNNHTFQSLPCLQHQIYAHHPPIYYPQASPPVGLHLPIIENYTLHDERRAMEKLYRRSERKRLKEKRKKREARHKRREERERRRNRVLTDKQIEDTYTGLDREIAEGFISFAMEPSVSKRRVRHSSSDHDIC